MQLEDPTKPQGRERMLEILRSGTDRYGNPFDLEKFNEYGRRYGKDFDELVGEGDNKEVVVRRLDSGEVITHRNNTKTLFVNPRMGKCLVEVFRMVFPSGKLFYAKIPERQPGHSSVSQRWTVRETRFRDETALACAFRGVSQEAGALFARYNIEIDISHLRPVVGRWTDSSEIHDSTVYYNMRSSTSTEWFELVHEDLPCDEPQVLVDVPLDEAGKPVYERRTEVYVEPREYSSWEYSRT